MEGFESFFSEVKDTLKCSCVGGKHGDLSVRLQSNDQ
jgi:hypothetical protein